MPICILLYESVFHESTNSKISLFRSKSLKYKMSERRNNRVIFHLTI